MANSKRSLKQSVSAKNIGGGNFDRPSNDVSNSSYNVGKTLSNSDLGSEFAAASTSTAPYSYNNNSTSANISSQQQQSHYNRFQSSTQQQQQQQQHMPPLSNTTKPRLSQEGNFTLLSRHSIRKEDHFKSGEICAICENSMLTVAGGHPQSLSSTQLTHFKCSECRQLFHNKCIHLSSDIPCIKEGCTPSSSFASSLSVLGGK